MGTALWRGHAQGEGSEDGWGQHCGVGTHRGKVVKMGGDSTVAWAQGDGSKHWWGQHCDMGTRDSTHGWGRTGVNTGGQYTWVGTALWRGHRGTL